MGRAYEGDQTRLLALELGYIPVVPPKTSRLEPWEYDRAMYNKRNEIQRLFRLLKEFRRIYSQDSTNWMSSFSHLSISPLLSKHSGGVNRA